MNWRGAWEIMPWLCTEKIRAVKIVVFLNWVLGSFMGIWDLVSRDQYMFREQIYSGPLSCINYNTV